ncbi:MAG: adenosylcobinamide amidohydrolase [Myxococcales bacterium]|nr:adenosylcobinamide amidohydrolase [Myxococcales bacterium]
MIRCLTTIVRVVLVVAAALLTTRPVLAQDHELVRTDGFVARRKGVALIVDLLTPHRVLTTSTVGPGLGHRLRHIVNIQSMEARGHERRLQARLTVGRARHHEMTAGHLGLPPEATALMGTAAHQGHLGHASGTFRELRVDAFATAGVHGNAVSAGDPASYHQTGNGARKVAADGTINVILIINQPVAPGAVVKAATVAVEAKVAALMSLAVPSTKSSELATGTGTDQLTIAVRLPSKQGPPKPNSPKPRSPTSRPATRTAGRVLESASQHLKLGQLIGETVRDAVRDAIERQNGLAPGATRSLCYALKRFGLTESRLRARLARHLSSEALQLLLANLSAIEREPRVAAAGFAFAAILDREQYGTIDRLSAQSVLRDQAATLAVAVAQRPDRYAGFWKQLSGPYQDRTDLAIHALAIGFAAKWRDDVETVVRRTHPWHP